MEHDTASVALLALLCLGLALAFPSEHHHHHPSSFAGDARVQMCGSKLSSALSMVCNGVYNTLNSKKVAQNMPFIAPQEAKAFLRRRRRGVIDECCRNPCTVDELRTFCGP